MARANRAATPPSSTRRSRPRTRTPNHGRIGVAAARGRAAAAPFDGAGALHGPPFEDQGPRRARVFAALRAAAGRPSAPFVDAASRAAAERSAALRLRAAAFACRLNAVLEAAAWGSRSSVASVARERFRDTGCLAPS